MTESLDKILAQNIEHLNIILLMGLAIFLGTAGARVFQKFRIPQVVGYIVIGILIGGSVLNVMTIELVESLAPFNIFALGIIGFMIGGELRSEVFKKYGRQFFVIMLLEGLFAFAIVNTDYLSITTSPEDDKFVGVLNLHAVRRMLSAEVLSRQQKADTTHSA